MSYTVSIAVTNDAAMKFYLSAFPNILVAAAPQTPASIHATFTVLLNATENIFVMPLPKSFVAIAITRGIKNESDVPYVSSTFISIAF
jgi:hypothetical protein